MSLVSKPEFAWSFVSGSTFRMLSKNILSRELGHGLLLEGIFCLFVLTSR